MVTESENALAFTFEHSKLFQPLVVMGWELRRLAVNRSTRIMAGAALCCFLGILFVRHEWGLMGDLVLLGTTTYGQLIELVYELMIVFGLALAFLTTDIVAHDYQQRMHELLMTTAMPTWAYIGGRYLAGLLIGLALAVILLVSQLTLNWTLAATDPLYPSPNPLVTLVFWGVIVIPATLLMSSLCFSLGTFWPRFTRVTKFGVCIAWVILAFDTDPLDLGWRAYWNPTGAGLATLLLKQLRTAVQTAIQTIVNPASQAQVALRLQQSIPNLNPWVGPYLTLAALGLLLVALASSRFRRFRDAIS